MLTHPIDAERLLERFLRYVRIDTTAGEVGPTYPSSPGQLVLGKMLCDELRALGLNAEQDKFGIVIATIPATIKEKTPVVAFNSHVDTSPETTGKNVQPQVIRNYAGGDIKLPAAPNKIIRISENPELNNMLGHTLVTTDGTTLLGSDDKSGIAVIMELAAVLVAHPEIPHGDVRICFTCDEEVGHGVDHVDLNKLAADVCYTLDGSGRDEIDAETFSADMAHVTIEGINIHPSIAKDRMVNAIRAAGYFLEQLPRHTLAPEKTDGRDGFLHPYTIEGLVAEVKLKLILRDFETAALADHAAASKRRPGRRKRNFPAQRSKSSSKSNTATCATGSSRNRAPWPSRSKR